MTPTEQNAMRDLLANAQAARKAAADLPEGVTEPQKEFYKKQRFRLELGALDCEAVACFLYWRDALETGQYTPPRRGRSELRQKATVIPPGRTA